MPVTHVCIPAETECFLLHEILYSELPDSLGDPGRLIIIGSRGRAYPNDAFRFFLPGKKFSQLGAVCISARSCPHSAAPTIT